MMGGAQELADRQVSCAALLVNTRFYGENAILAQPGERVFGDRVMHTL
jgi:hypothetical protein